MLRCINVIIRMSNNYLIRTEKASFACVKHKKHRRCSLKRPPKNKKIFRTACSFSRQSQQLQINEALETNCAEQCTLCGMLSCGASINILCSHNPVIDRPYLCQWEVSPSRFLGKMKYFTYVGDEKWISHFSERCIQPKRMLFLQILISILKAVLSLIMLDVTLHDSGFLCSEWSIFSG